MPPAPVPDCEVVKLKETLLGGVHERVVCSGPVHNVADRIHRPASRVFLTKVEGAHSLVLGVILPMLSQWASLKSKMLWSPLLHDGAPCKRGIVLTSA